MKRQIWCTSFVSKSKTIGSWRSNDGNGYENFTEVWIRAASIFIALIPSCSIRSIVVKRRGNSGTPEGGEGRNACKELSFLLLLARPEFPLTLSHLTPATQAIENVEFNKKYMAHPIVISPWWQIPKAGNSRLDKCPANGKGGGGG